MKPTNDLQKPKENIPNRRMPEALLMRNNSYTRVALKKLLIWGAP